MTEPTHYKISADLRKYLMDLFGDLPGRISREPLNRLDSDECQPIEKSED